MLAETWPYQFAAVVRFAFRAGQAQLSRIIWPVSSPDAKLSLGRGANNPAKTGIERLKIPSFDR